MAKINISIDDNLLSRVNEFADSNYISRSGLISLALSQYLDAQDVASAIKRMSRAMQVIAEKGEVDEHTLAELENFKLIADMLYGKN